MYKMKCLSQSLIYYIGLIIAHSREMLEIVEGVLNFWGVNEGFNFVGIIYGDF